MDAITLRRRLRALREDRGWSQEDLAARMGINDRQTISAIEAGSRRISAEELVKAAEVFNVDLDIFTDSFRLVGEGRFSWRQHDGEVSQLRSFEERTGRWIATYRELLRMRGELPTPLMPRVGLTDESTFEDAHELGDRVAQVLELGEVPSIRLRDVIEKKLQTLVLDVDTIPGVSGAACQLPELNTILINRNESVRRRNYDLAHELFHLLTWDALPPRHIESEHPTERRDRRVEQLADNFAASLLMPSSALAPHLVQRAGKELHEWINATATILGVSSIALKWRLVNIGALSHRDEIDDDHLRHNGDTEAAQTEPPPRFGYRFVSVLASGISEGHLSVRRAAQLLEMTIDELSELFIEHETDPPFDL